MSSRLTHTPSGYIRLMQMSGNTVFAFVEGKTDRYLYGRLCNFAYQSLGTGHEIATVPELPVTVPGKPGLLEWFNFLRTNNALCSVFQGKKTVAVFFADKDLDDLVGTMIISDHFIYTDAYSLENHLFEHGSLSDALAASAMLDITSVKAALPVDGSAWCTAAANSWREWVYLCFAAQHLTSNCPVNYSRPSQIHSGAYQPADTTQKQAYLARVKQASGLNDAAFAAAFAQYEFQVDQLYAAGRCGVVFSGKWFTDFACEDAKRIAAGRAYNTKSLPDRLTQTLAVTVDLSEGWFGSTATRLQLLLGCGEV